MEVNLFSRSYLENLSNGDLFQLADDFGLDAPEDLDRRFLIEEFLKIEREVKKSEPEDILEVDLQQVSDSKHLPLTYNETCIHAILRNPVWAFVWWDFSAADFKRLKNDDDFLGIMIRVSFFENWAFGKENVQEKNPVDFFDIFLNAESRKRYIFLPADKKIVRFDLAAQFSSKKLEFLVSSQNILIPHGSRFLSQVSPGKELNLEPILELSGMGELLNLHYKNHRQAFS